MTNTLAHLTTSATVRSGLGIFALGLVAVAVLSACGGGDAVKVASSSTTTTTPKTYLTSSSPATPTLTVTAGTLRYMIQGNVDSSPVSITGTTATPLTYGTGNSLNAVIGIDTHSLAAAGSTPTYAVQYFMGDTTFALGRWTKGRPTINNVPATTPLSGTDSTAVHYLITRDLGGFLQGTYPCNIDKVWTSGLTYSGNNGGTVPSDTTAVGALIPNATIRIPVNGGTATLSVDDFPVYAGIAANTVPAHTVTFATPIVGPQEAADSLYLSSGGEGIAYVLGEGPSLDKITLGIAFRRTMFEGPRYKGMTTILCTKTP